MDDNKIEYLSNPEVGNIWAGWIIDFLAKSWPMTEDIDVFEVIRKTGVSPRPEIDSGEFLGNLVSWLKQEGFLEGEGITFENYVLKFTITAKTLDILSKRPPSLGGKSVKEALSDAARDVGKEVAKNQVADIFGQIVGGIIKSVTF